MNNTIIRKNYLKYKREINVVYIFLAIFSIFIIFKPYVFLKPDIYNAVFTSVPIIIILTIPIVFVITSGEMDLSFGSVMGISGYSFAIITTKTNNPFLGMVACFLTGLLCGYINGILITKLKLSSLVTTLGMMFFLRGVVMVLTQGNATPLVQLDGSIFSKIFVSKIGNFPVQMFWAIAASIFLWFLFHRFRFGIHTHFVGDNRESAREMGINVDKTIIGCYMLVGFAASFSAILSALINKNFWPSTGDGYLLIILAAAFVGGTPTWGGVGTVFGAFLGAIIMGFLQTGIIAIGLTGFYTNLVYGLMIVLSIISHRYSSERKR